MSLLLTLSMILGAFEQGMVRARELATDAPRDAHEGITIAAEAYDKDRISAKGGPAVLPVYLVISNSTKDALKLDVMSVTLEGPSGQKYPRIAGIDVEQRLRGAVFWKGGKPSTKKPPQGITDQEFLVKMVPPGDTIRGFMYFDDTPKSAAGLTLYLNGLTWASNGKELLFFEIGFKVQSGDAKKKP